MWLVSSFATAGLRLRLRVDMDHHSWTLVAVVSAFKLLQHNWSSVSVFVPVSKHEAFLDEIEALARLRLVLLANVLRSVSKACLLKEVEFGPLEEPRISIVFIGEQKLHWFLHLGHSQLVKFVDGIFLLPLRFLLMPGVVLLAGVSPTTIDLPSTASTRSPTCLLFYSSIAPTTGPVSPTPSMLLMS